MHRHCTRTLVSIVCVSVCALAEIAALDGGYTADQAERGKVIFSEHCGVCHGTDLTGLEGPALSGAGFALSWQERSVADLFVKIRDTMPADDPDSLTQAEKIDVVAYLLQRNGFEAGTSALTVDLALAAHAPLWPTSPNAPPATGALASSTGCLRKEADGWVLADATPPQRVRAAVASSTTDTGVASDRTHVVRLLNVFPDPSPNTGKLLQVSGLAVNNGGNIALNVLSMEVVAAGCAP